MNLRKLLKGKRFKNYFSYFLIILICFVGYNYSKIFISLDFDGYYGKYIGGRAYNFQLKEVSGKKISLDDFKGRFVLITFGFTKCTGVCPLNLYHFQSLSKKMIRNKIENVDFAFISFDRIRDDSIEMDSFIKKFTIKNMKGLLSDKDQGLDVARKYKNYIPFDIDKIKKDSEYQVNHNGFIYLIDPQGELKLIYMQENVNEEKIIQDLLKLKKKFS